MDQRHYNKLIDRAKNRLLEKHHVIPKCMDGLNETKNLEIKTKTTVTRDS